MAKKRGQYKKEKLYTGGYKLIRKGKLSNKEYIGITSIMMLVPQSYELFFIIT